jgi:hypothetical protein
VPDEVPENVPLCVANDPNPRFVLEVDAEDTSDRLFAFTIRPVKDWSPVFVPDEVPEKVPLCVASVPRPRLVRDVEAEDTSERLFAATSKPVTPPVTAPSTYAVVANLVELFPAVSVTPVG